MCHRMCDTSPHVDVVLVGLGRAGGLEEVGGGDGPVAVL